MPKEQDKNRWDCGAGWHDILDRLTADIKAVITAITPRVKVDKVFKILQVKEKFGCLRYYYYLDLNEAHRNKIYALVRAAEKESSQTCETCGKPGKVHNDLSWVKTLCDVHRTELDIKYIIE